ncbi:M48 family metalloprotease [Halomarina rubra]|uniref:M48 family metalloprotease n=1 Tax=Halomarina rubra TaxID=2071873 RepID=A0ABD6ATA1_9EURY|nr:M48 family metalloprotease [Halomarina rubra]
MDWSPDRHLQLRMAATLFALVLTVVVATLAVWGIVLAMTAVAGAVVGGVLEREGLLRAVGVDSLVSLWVASSALLTIGLVGYVAHRQRTAPDYAVATTGARRVDRSDAPALLDTVRSVAQQADTPVPDVYLAPTETPLSLVTGYAESNTHLVVSTGLLDALDERELEAVLAHELAHVKNRDATVMTTTGLLTMAASRVFELLRGPTAGVEHGRVSRASYADAVVTVGLLFAAPVWAVGRVLGASLSRAREFAADRGAAAITGDPAALASALRSVEERLAEHDAPDRRSPVVASLSIVGRSPPAGSTVLGPVWRLGRRMLASHPPTSARTERLRHLERRQETTTITDSD